MPVLDRAIACQDCRTAPATASGSIAMSGPTWGSATFRTGHGIGLDGHEWTYLVRRNKTPIEPGMCFSNEPTIAIPGEFGIRLEDCMYVTEDGARMFSRQSP